MRVRLRLRVTPPPQCSITKSRGVGVLVRDGGKGVFDGCTIDRSTLSGVVISHRGDPKFTACAVSNGADAGVLVTDSGASIERI